MTGAYDAASTPNSRTYKKHVEAGQKGLSTEDIRRNKNQRAHQRNAARKQERLDEITSRREAWQSLSPQKQLAELDRRLGVGVGAGKQRARIKFLIENPPKEPKPTVLKQGGNKQHHHHKKVKSFNRHQQSR